MAGIYVRGARNVTVSGNIVDGSHDAGVLLQDSYDIRVKNNTVSNVRIGFKVRNCGDIYGEGNRHYEHTYRETNTHYERAHFLKGFEGKMGFDWAELQPLCVAVKEVLNGNVGY